MSLVNHISKAEQDMCLPFYVVREFEIIQKKKKKFSWQQRLFLSFNEAWSYILFAHIFGIKGDITFSKKKKGVISEPNIETIAFSSSLLRISLKFFII